MASQVAFDYDDSDYESGSEVRKEEVASDTTSSGKKPYAAVFAKPVQFLEGQHVVNKFTPIPLKVYDVVKKKYKKVQVPLIKSIDDKKCQTCGTYGILLNKKTKKHCCVTCMDLEGQTMKEAEVSDKAMKSLDPMILVSLEHNWNLIDVAVTTTFRLKFIKDKFIENTCHITRYNNPWHANLYLVQLVDIAEYKDELSTPNQYGNSWPKTVTTSKEHPNAYVLKLKVQKGDDSFELIRKTSDLIWMQRCPRGAGVADYWKRFNNGTGAHGGNDADANSDFVLCDDLEETRKKLDSANNENDELRETIHRLRNPNEREQHFERKIQQMEAEVKRWKDKYEVERYKYLTSLNELKSVKSKLKYSPDDLKRKLKSERTMKQQVRKKTKRVQEDNKQLEKENEELEKKNEQLEEQNKRSLELAEGYYDSTMEWRARAKASMN